jgi:hypothetical protein
MTVTDWIRENYAEYGRDYVINGIELCKEITNHQSSASTWERQVRRIIRELEGSGPTPEESYQVKTIEDALSYHDVPEASFSIKKATFNTWGSETNQNQQVKLEMVREADTLDPEVWVKAFTKALAVSQQLNTTPLPPTQIPHNYGEGKFVHLLSIPDIHIGKIVYGESITSSEDYTPEIAATIFKSAVKYLASHIQPHSTKEIIFPIGEDIANADNMQMTTTKGTPQENSDIYHMIATITSTLFTIIDYLADIAPVRIPVISGNHDRLVSHLLGLIIEQRYKDDERVTVDSSPVREKVYSDGQFCFLLVHGDKAKPKDLSWRLATNYPQEWASSKFRYVFSGHWHTNMVSDEQGVLVIYLPTLAEGGLWEDIMNYASQREAQLHTFDSARGRIATAYFSPHW